MRWEFGGKGRVRAGNEPPPSLEHVTLLFAPWVAAGRRYSSCCYCCACPCLPLPGQPAGIKTPLFALPLLIEGAADTVAFQPQSTGAFNQFMPVRLFVCCVEFRLGTMWTTSRLPEGIPGKPDTNFNNRCASIMVLSPSRTVQVSWLLRRYTTALQCNLPCIGWYWRVLNKGLAPYLVLGGLHDALQLLIQWCLPRLCSVPPSLWAGICKGGRGQGGTEGGTGEGQDAGGVGGCLESTILLGIQGR